MRIRSRFVLDREENNKGTFFASEQEENGMTWFKDAAAGVGLLLFVVSSFVLTGAAQALLA